MALLVADKALTAVGEQVALILGLEHLSPHFRTVVFSALGFHVVELLAGPISARLFGQRYTRLKLNARRTWAERFVSLAHASVLLPLTFHAKFYSAAAETLARDKAFGWHPDVGRLFGFSVGYFVWDTIHALRNFTDAGFIVHGATCLALYTNGFRPFLAYYGSAFLLWETSTPLVNFHWFFDKLGMTGSMPQLINGILLLLTFLFVRIFYGGYLSWQFYGTMQSIKRQIPALVYYSYLFGNAVLNFLNWLWFYKMIKALRKRFTSSKPS